MTKTNCVLSFAAACALVATPAIAGDDYGTSVSGASAGALSSESNSGDWCDTLKGIGKIYKDKKNPFIQEFKVFGRVHYQYAYVDGEDVNGDDFSEDHTTFRRVRGGAQIKFLNYFKAKAEANFVSDNKHNGGDRDWGYQSLQEAYIDFNAGKAFNIGFFDKSSVQVGKIKLPVGFEQHTSSKGIKTVERSAIANKVRDGDATGIKFKASKGNWSGALGYYSNEDNPELSFFGEDEGELFLATSSFKFGSDKLILDFLYTHGEEDGAGDLANSIDWVGSAAYIMNRGRFTLATNVFYGENGGSGDRDGAFYGIVIQPSYYLIDDVLEVVGQYQWQGSEESEGIRTNSRYFRADTNFEGNDDDLVNDGRGDSHHSIYAGLNWYHCDDNSKVMLGVEYETLDTPLGDADATTLWAAYRFFF